MITVDGYYNGKTVDVMGKLVDVLPQISSIKHCVIVPFAMKRPILQKSFML